MMPSHSMDLPVPRGTSMLMLSRKFTSYGTKTDAKCRCALFVSHSKYVLMTSFCFSADGKSFTRRRCRAASQITLSLKIFVGLFSEIECCDFYLNFEFNLCSEFELI